MGLEVTRRSETWRDRLGLSFHISKLKSPPRSIPGRGCSWDVRDGGHSTVPLLRAVSPSGEGEAGPHLLRAVRGVHPGCPEVGALQSSLLPSTASSDLVVPKSPLLAAPKATGTKPPLDRPPDLGSLHSREPTFPCALLRPLQGCHQVPAFSFRRLPASRSLWAPAWG